MISVQSIQSFNRLYQSALHNNCRRTPDDSFSVNAGTNNPLLKDNNPAVSNHLLVLSVSSYLFRIITFFDFKKDVATEHYFKSNYIPGTEAALVSEHALLDAFSEFSNMVCGEVNRGLAPHFKHVGMSTPFSIAPGCLPFIATLKQARILSFQVTINSDIEFTVTSCICADPSATIDFLIHENHLASVSTGDLELF